MQNSAIPALWAATVLVGLGAPAARADMTAREFNQQAEAGVIAGARGKCDLSLAILRRVIVSARLVDLTDPGAALVLAVGFGCLGTRDNTGKGPTDEQTAARAAERADWVAASEILTRGHPAALSLVSLRAISLFDDDLRHSGQLGERRRFLAALAAAGYRPPDPFDHADVLWFGYAALLADAGDLDDAARAVDRLETPEALEKVRLDKRFAPLLAAHPERFDVVAVAERRLAADQAVMRARPGLAHGVFVTGRDLLLLGRDDEALKLAQDAIGGEATSHGGQSAFTDWSARGSSIVELRAWSLRGLGRNEEWLSAYTQAARVKESGKTNVDQTVNLSDVLIRLGRDQDALNLLRQFGEDGRHGISPNGRLWVLSNRVCALEALGMAAEAADVLSLLKADATDNPAAMTDALYCADDLDAIAADYVHRLADPEDRDNVLIRLSRFKDFHPEVADLPYDAERAKRRDAVAARPDVKAAVAAVGRTELIPLQSGVF